MTGDQEPFMQYGRMEEAASHFLYEAFRHAYLAAQHEIAGLIFGDLIDIIDTPAGWKAPEMPSSLPEILTSEAEVLPEETISALSAAWEDAQRQAISSTRKVARRHSIQSVELASHAIDLTAAVEVILNRELFLSREEGSLLPDHFNSLDAAPILAKVLYLFKDETSSGSINTSRLSFLLRLRNSAVHLRASRTKTLSATPEELIGIWKSVSTLLGFVRGDPSREEFDSYWAEVAHRWFE